jgi:protein PET100
LPPSLAFCHPSLHADFCLSVGDGQIRDQFWPKEESLYRPPRTSDDVRTALDEMKQKRLARRQERLQLDQAQAQSANTNTEATEPKVISMLEDAARTNQRLV